MSGIGVTSVNYFRYDARKPLSIANPVADLNDLNDQEQGYGITVASNPAPLGVYPSSVEPLFYLKPTKVINAQYLKAGVKWLSTPKVGSVDENDNSTGGSWHYSDVNMECTYALSFPSLKWKLPPFGAGATLRYHTQNYIDDYNSPSRTSYGFDLAVKGNWPKGNFMTLALLDAGTHFKGNIGDSDRLPTSIYFEDEYSIFKDQVKSVKIDANATGGVFERRFTDLNFGAEGALNYLNAVNLVAQLGFSYNGQLYPVIGVGLGYKSFVVNGAIKFSQLLGQNFMVSCTFKLGAEKKLEQKPATAEQKPAEKPAAAVEPEKNIKEAK
jgi:hypothetical protein